MRPINLLTSVVVGTLLFSNIIHAGPPIMRPRDVDPSKIYKGAILKTDECKKAKCPDCPTSSGTTTTSPIPGGDLQFVSDTGRPSLVCFTYVRDPGGRIPLIAIETSYTNSSLTPLIPNGIPICMSVTTASMPSSVGTYKLCRPSSSDSSGRLGSGINTSIGRVSAPFISSAGMTLTIDSENAIEEPNETNNIIHCTSFVSITTTSETGSVPDYCLGGFSTSYTFDPTVGYEGPCPLITPPTTPY